MSYETIDILVDRKAAMGLSTIDYAEELRERLPNQTIVRATTPGEERSLVKKARVLTAETLDERLLSNAEQLELFACSASGTSHLPLKKLQSKGVSLTNAAGIHAPAIAEQTIGYMLVYARNLDQGWRQQSRREWRLYHGNELQGKSVTVVGLGEIGTAVAERVKAFGVNTIGVRYTPSKGGPTDSVIGFSQDEFYDALSETDYLLITTPLSDTTEQLIGEAEFATLPVNSFVVNVARGRVVDTEALVTAIRKNIIGGAALDVTDPEPLPEEHPLWGFENVFITPHMGGNTPEHWSRLADIVAENIKIAESTGQFENLRNQIF